MRRRHRCAPDFLQYCLVSPLMAAAAAIEGHFVDVRTLNVLEEAPA